MATNESDGFSSLGLRPELLRAIEQLGYEEPTPVQRAALPALISGRDVLGQAATGTGKTAAFALPILNKIEPHTESPFRTSALIVVPTRELAMQVAEAVHSYGKTMGISVLPVYGGQDIGLQLRRLKRGVDVVVATPGRALDHLKRKTLKLDKVQALVLDEADEMLDLGFADDLEAILSEVPEGTQTALFSATLPPRIAAIAERHLENPVRVTIEPEKAKAGSLPKIRQTAYVVPAKHKEVALGRVLDVESPPSALIFCRTRIEVERLAEVLSGHGYEAAALHGGMTQEQRDRVLKAFKSHKLQILIATDVAARGLHVEKLTHVFNYDLPNSPEPYVHRIGRTGRAGQEGTAITFVEPREIRLLRNIERVTGQKIEVGQLPTVVDLRARRLEQTRQSVEEAMRREDLGEFRNVVERLAEDGDLVDIAAASVAALHDQLNPGREADQIEIPKFEREPSPPPRGGRGRPQMGPPSRGARPERRERPAGGAEGARHAPLGARVYVGAGRTSGIKPGDLVGAIAHEAGLTAGEIGAIQIADHYSIVEVAEGRVHDVVEGLQRTKLRGQRVKVEPYRPGGLKATRQRE